MELTYKQLKWLDERGGRTEDDLRVDDDGFYVEMTNGRGGITRIYLPEQWYNNGTNRD